MTAIIRRETTDSTNADAMSLAREGHAESVWVVAREQVGGRGRRGRAWQSPRGNLYASLLLVDPCPADIAPQLGFVAGVALVDAVGQLLGSGHVQLKWPNDLLSKDGAKIAGILLEASRCQADRLACVVGIGVNCRSHPDDLHYAATNLSALAGRDINPDDLFASLASSMVQQLAAWDAGRNFAAIRRAWLARAANVGGPVMTIARGQTIHGTFETIDATGRLMISTTTGQIAVDAGDVQFGQLAACVPAAVA